MVVTHLNPHLRTVLVLVLSVLPATAAGEAGKDERGLPILPGEKEGMVNVRKALEAKAMSNPEWPAEWLVFGPLPRTFTRAEPATLAKIPDELEIDGKAYSPQRFKMTDEIWLDLKPLLPADLRKKKMDQKEYSAYCFVEFECPEDGTLYVNTTSYWWMEWYIDGRKVHSTLATGNCTPAEQLRMRGFNVPLTKGKHVTAVLVQGSKWGWKLRAVAGFSPRPPADMQDHFEAIKTVKVPEKMPFAQRNPKLQPVPPVLNTEARRIIKEVEAPARFAEYKPRLKVSERFFLEENSWREQVYTKNVAYDIHDGDRRIGQFRHFCGVNMHLTEMNPNGDWSADGKPGDRYCRLLIGGILRNPGPHTEKITWNVDPSGEGVTVENRRVPADKDAWDVYRTVSTIRVDPVCGYVVDSMAEFSTRKLPPSLFRVFTNHQGRVLGSASHEGNEYCNVLPSHVIHYTTSKTLFPWRYERTIYTPRDSDKYVGWIDDTWQAEHSDDHGLHFRKDGFVAFTQDPQGWTQAFSRNSPDDVSFNNATCWKLQDQHNHVHIPKPVKLDRRFRVRVFHRFHNLPPEVTRYLLERVEMMFGESHRERDFIMVSMGRVRDFESDKREKATAPPWTDGIPVAEILAHSGKKCVAYKAIKDQRGEEVKRFKTRIDPLPVLEKATRYRLEAWVKVQGAGSKARLHVQPALWEPIPCLGPKLVPTDSGLAEADDKWQKLSVEFGTPKDHGRTPTLSFRTELADADSAVYLDDILCTRLGPLGDRQ